MKLYNFLVLILIVLWASCGRKRSMDAVSIPTTTEEWAHHLFDTSGVHSGLFVIEAGQSERPKPILDYHSSSLFTPASNTKILTLYGALQFLPETLVGVKWIRRNDTVYFKGTGDPGFLDPRFDVSPTLSFFKQQNNLVYLGVWNSDERWAPGWSWEDYPYYYAAQRSPFPIYGNMARTWCQDDQWLMEPSGFIVNRYFDPSARAVRRNERANIFQVNTAKCRETPLRIPFVTNPDVVCHLLSDTLHQAVEWTDLSGFNYDSGSWQSVPGSDRDTLLRAMMYESDNFIAEQMLWSVSSALWDTISTTRVIDSVMTDAFSPWKGKIHWVDGSGLSVYNKLSPRFLVDVLQRLYGSMEHGELLRYFPAGGVRGTIASWYGHDDMPFVYAKTGTLSGVHCLSGYLLADSGKTYVFSFMHNNYLGSSSQYKKKMDVLLRWIKENH